MDADTLISNLFTSIQWLHESVTLSDRRAALQLKAEVSQSVGETLMMYYEGALYHVEFQDCGSGLSFWQITRRSDGKMHQLSSRWGMDY